MVGFGPRHRVVPNRNLGQNLVAQRRLVEAAGRAAESARVSVSVDAWPCRVFLRNLRPTLACPCTLFAGASRATPEGPSGFARVTLDGGEFDDIDGIDPGFPRGNERDDVPGQDLRVREDGDQLRDVNLTVQRLLAGNGRRCGICWGTGWIDGHVMWGGNRRVMCTHDAPGVAQVGGDADVDVAATTPTMRGPGQVTWSVRVNSHDCRLDALRVREGLLPAAGGCTLEASADGGATWQTPAAALSPTGDSSPSLRVIRTGDFQFRLTLADGARCSHVELVSRSEPLVNLQLPQLAQSASADLIAPFLEEDVELDPVVGFVERGTILDVEPRDGRLGQLWMMTTVTVKRTAAGQVYGVVGTARNAQPTDVWACASMTDAVRSGLLDRGFAPRGLESTGGGVAGGLDGVPDESIAAVRRGTSPRLGGGSSDEARPTIVLSQGDY